MTFLSFAQNFEDVVLWRCLRDIPRGCYLDIGAQDPNADSVSRAFYDLGWRGVHVEANAYYAQLIREARPDELVIEALMGDGADGAIFFEIPSTGLSTAVADIAQHHRDAGYQVQETHVASVTLSDVFDGFDGRPIHWMKVDVEGMEASVLRSWYDNPARPWILSIESTYPNSQTPVHQEWIDLVTSRGYAEVYYDGLSRYFVHQDHRDRAAKFDAPPNVFDGFAVTAQHFTAGWINHQNGQERDALRASLREAETLLATREQELQMASGRQAELASRLDTVSRDFGHASARLVDARVQIAKQRQDFLVQLTADRSQLEALLAWERSRVESLLVECEGLRTRAAEGTARLAEGRALFEQALGALVEERSSATAAHQQQLSVIKKQLGDAYDAADAAKRDQNRMLGELDALQRGLAAIRAEKSDIDAALRQAGIRIAGQAADLDRAAEQARGYETQLEGASREIRNRTSQLAETRARYDQLASTRWWKWGIALGFARAVPLPDDLIGSGWGADEGFAEQVREDRALQGSFGTADQAPIGSLAELLGLHDERFIRACYRRLLAREADPAGLAHYLRMLRGGASKMRILRGMLRSSEARENGAPLPGLDRAIIRYTRGNWPVVGWFLRRLWKTDGEGVIERQMRQIGNHVGRLGYDQATISRELHQVHASVVSIRPARGGREHSAQIKIVSASAPAASNRSEIGAAFAPTDSARSPLARFFEETVWNGR